jgi:hypothetical protein
MNKQLRRLTMIFLVVLAGIAITIPLSARGLNDGIIDPPPPPSDLPNNGYGVWLLPSMEGAERLSETDTRWVTLFLNWGHVEKTPGVYDWSSWDEALKKAANNGYNVILTVIDNPGWAADTTCGPIKPEHLDDFATFLNHAVARYSYAPYTVKIWSLYNEPDNSNAEDFVWLGGCWGDAGNPKAAPGAGGTAYANMLKKVYPAIKSANPNTYVAMGGLAYDYFTTDPEHGVFDPLFLDDMLAAGAADYFDFINFHYYPWSGWRWEPEPFDRYNRHIDFKARWMVTEVYNASGKKKPILCTEVGETSHNKQKEPDFRRQILAIYQNILEAQMVNVYPITWFTGIDLNFSINYDGRRYGLLNLDGSPKPSYYAYKALVDELKDATFDHPRNDLPNRFEGYVFNDRGRKKTVLWMYDNETAFPPPQPAEIPVSQTGGTMRVVKVRTWPRSEMDYALVSEITITDGGPKDLDNQADGKIRVMIDQDIRFFEDLSMPAYTPTPTEIPTRWVYLPLFIDENRPAIVYMPVIIR